MRASTFYVPTCACGLEGARASTGALRINSETKGGRVTYSVTLYVGPSCDTCGKPWVASDKANRGVTLR